MDIRVSGHSRSLQSAVDAKRAKAPKHKAKVRQRRSGRAVRDRVGPFGIGWTHAYDIRIEEDPSNTPTDDSLNFADRTDFFGAKHKYHRDADGLYFPPANLYDEMSSAYGTFLTDGPANVLSDTDIGEDGTVKHYTQIGNERVCDSITDRYGNATFLTYNWKGNADMEKLQQQKAPYNDPDLNALFAAATSNDRAKAEMLIRSTVSPSHQAAVLDYLMLVENYAAADLLIEAGIDPDSVVGECSLLAIAAARNNIEMVTFLLDKGADPQKKNGRSRWTPIDFATVGGYPEIVALLMSRVKKD